LLRSYRSPASGPVPEIQIQNCIQTNILIGPLKPNLTEFAVRQPPQLVEIREIAAKAHTASRMRHLNFKETFSIV
jgi:hypothetical protein